MAQVFQALKLRQLQRIAHHCGIGKAGTKEQISQRIDAAVLSHRPIGAGERILSIDMGIRNFAFCLLTPNGTVPPAPSSQAKSKSKKAPEEIKSTATGGLVPPALTMHAWRVLDLTQGDKEATTKGPKALSATAVDLIQTYLLPLTPTRVLIERQRFRTEGMASVLETTLVVNSLESMLYAIFSALRYQGTWQGVEEAVDPKAVAGHCLDAQGEIVAPDARAAAQAKKKKFKREKTDLVGGWIRDSRLGLGDGKELRDMVASFLRKWEGRAGGKKEKAKKDEDDEPAKLRKVDDLADCVLQGAVWMKWQENRSSLARLGADDFLLSMDGTTGAASPKARTKARTKSRTKSRTRSGTKTTQS